VLSDSDIPTKRREADGERIGKFVRSAKLGSGGMGDVWKAWDTQLDRWVALKFLRGGDAEEVARFRREAQLAAKLSHPNVAAVYEIGEVESRPFIAMEYVDGRTLKSLGRGDRRRVVEIVRDAARGVAYAHAHGVVHHDVKPENVMVTTSGRVFVMDFGLARSVSADRSTTGAIIGTPSYMSPEQARGERTDARSDVYSLGATLFTMLTGRPPHEDTNVIALLRKVGEGEAPSPRSIDETIPRDLEAIALKALEGRVEARYADAGAVADDLDRWLRGDPVIARPPAAVSKVGRALRKRWPALGAAIALVAAGVIAAALWHRANEARKAQQAQEERVRLEREAADRARNRVNAGTYLLEQAKLARRESGYDVKVVRRLADRAEGEFTAALEAKPEDPEALLGLARVECLRQAAWKALPLLDRAVASAPTFVGARVLRLELRLGTYEGMRHETGGRTRLETPEATRLRGLIDADLKELARQPGESAIAEFAAGSLAFADGDYATAESRFARYLAAVPSEANARFWRGHALMHLKRHREGEEELTRALQSDTRWAEAYFNRAGLRQSMDPQAALADLDACIALGLTSTEVYAMRGGVLLAMGRAQEAHHDLSHALKLSPDSVPLLVRRAWCLLLLNEVGGAELDLDAALKLDSANADGHMYLGIVREHQGRRPEALECYTRAITLRPSLNCYANRGLARRAAGDLAGAVEDFESALRAEPGHADRAKVEAQLAETRAMIKK
jgi:tetratricopeptide (TPR) repeat protein/predicted Ser/Thr protein kinase